MTSEMQAQQTHEETRRVITVPPVRVVFEEADRKRILQEIDSVLTSGMVAAGKKVAAFEEFWAAYTGCRHAIACSSGGAALEILMKALDVRGKDVLVPTNTFIATVNAVIVAGGNPVFLDLDERTMGVNLEEIQRKRTENTVGVVVVHIGGIISQEVEGIAEWCRAADLWLVEDAAHAHGSELNGKRAGGFGIGAAYSFFATKVVTSGEGGMVVCNDDGLSDLCRSLRDYGRRSQGETVHTQLSSNYRMNDITAVIGHDQCQRLDEFIEYRHQVAQEYTRRLEGTVELLLPRDRCSWYKYMLLPPEGVSQKYMRTEMKARAVSLAGGVYDMPVHQQPVFQERGDISPLPLADKYCSRHICIPIFFGITDAQVDHVVTSLEDVLECL